MVLSRMLLWVMIPFFQAAAVPSFTEGILNSREKQEMTRATKVEQRIKVYENASKRIMQTVFAFAADGEFSQIPDIMKLWNSLLTGSLEDIEANLKTKKKPRALIRYEIQVRKALATAQDYRNNMPIEQLEAFDAHLAKAEKIRKRFVEIIFRH